jgi:hypothetical protein
MNRKINDDQSVLDGRKKVLENQQNEESLRDKIVKVLYNKVKEEELGIKIKALWDQANSDRTDWLDRQEEYLSDWDEFLDIEPQGIFETSSNLHVPMPLWVTRTYHARFMQTLLNPEPSLSIKARRAAFSDIVTDIEALMRHALVDWANYNEGVDEALDQWVWSWVTTGLGYLKWRWDKRFVTYRDVEKFVQEGIPKYVNDEEGNIIEVPTVSVREQEVKKTDKVFDGPILEFIPVEDVVVIGPDICDVDGSDAVIHRSFMTASEMWTLVDRGIFDEDAVKAVIDSGKDYKSGSNGGNLKQARANSDSANVDRDYELDRYEVLESYVKMDVDGSGINSDVVVWVHYGTGEILRATYLHRINKKGMRPFAVSVFHKRSGTNQNMPVGLIEMLHPISKEMDAMHNMRIDFGMISTMPFGFYRASSSLDPKTIEMEPGKLFPLDNPQADVYFPNLGNRTVFGLQEENALNNMVERMTGISDLSLGAMSGRQGATRTATGTRALVSESNTNLDIPLKRLNRGWKRALLYLLYMLQQRTPKGYEFRILGPNGVEEFKRLHNIEDISGEFDIEVSPNTAASNKQIQIQNAQTILQTVQNPILIQLGIVTPPNIYEAVKNFLQVIGIKDYSKFINTAQENQVVLHPNEEVERVLMGERVEVTMNGQHEKFIAKVEEVINDENAKEVLTQQQIEALLAQSEKHQQMLEAIEQMQAQQANSQQQVVNSDNAASGEGVEQQIEGGLMTPPPGQGGQGEEG